jgi:hypothetical protein
MYYLKKAIPNLYGDCKYKFPKWHWTRLITNLLFPLYQIMGALWMNNIIKVYAGMFSEILLLLQSPA